MISQNIIAKYLTVTLYMFYCAYSASPVNHWFGLVWFGLVLWHINHCKYITTKSFLYIHIKYMISQKKVLMTLFNESELIFLFKFTWFHLILVILFTIYHLILIMYFLTVKSFQVLLFNTNNAIKLQSFVTQLNEQLYFKQFSLACQQS